MTWQELSRPSMPLMGRLLESDEKLSTKLRALGVRQDRPVLVYAAPPKGWGEDGRIVWSLRTLGHSRVALVDGGFAALRRAGAKIIKGAAKNAQGDFVVRRRTAWNVSTRELVRLLDTRDRPRLLDTRERREFEGARPWGEKRGGHLPGALHLHWRTLLDARGLLRPAAELRRLLTRKGIARKRPIVAYCTGGVRSAWLVVVLEHLGYGQVKNYPGSIWAWAAADAKSHPLISGGTEGGK